MTILTTYISWTFLVLGGFLCISGAVGLLRFPDFFTRMHAASVTDTLATALIILGLLLQTDAWMVQVKLVMVLVFVLLTSPTASHALAKAALHGGLKPQLKIARGSNKAGQQSEAEA
ncbi:MAG: monovalent cation/H(+) antiporter subunit G [Gammaproteobacteria bacterium]|nr:monovalent cation/H(+) antiporter subunit G [Gammaproteobacteria bacterium]MDP2139604.1 monovalent cation/H(+) antiporter subunit G [Gammaproteobacteria bacterium]MDP2346577.1 monovalent cation/H(+) antiporter subunit G [Gammaproteobacteria bacterium]